MHPCDLKAALPGYILARQLLNHTDALIQWDDYYGLNNEQMYLVETLFERKIKNGEKKIYLLPEETKYLYGNIELCLASLEELNIFPPIEN